MRADIEDEIPGADKAGIELPQGHAPGAVAAIDEQRAGYAARRPQDLEHLLPHAARGCGCGGRAAVSNAGKASACSSGGGSVSSGSRPNPQRASARPMLGMAVITAKGMDTARPALTNNV